MNPSKSAKKLYSPRNQQKTSDLLLTSRRTKSNQPAQNLPNVRSKIRQPALIKDKYKILNQSKVTVSVHAFIIICIKLTVVLTALQAQLSTLLFYFT